MPIRAAVLRFAIAGLGLFCSFAGGANAQDRACTPLMWGKFETGLARSDPKVLHRDVYFDHLARKYALLTLSDTGRGQDRDQCFRYEVENSSDRDIQQLFWELAEIRTDKLAPGRWHRTSKVKIRPILENPIDVKSDIFVFENTKTETRAWAPREKIADSSSVPKTWLARMGSIEPHDLVPGLANLFKQFNMPSTPIRSFLMSESGVRADTLRDYFTGFGFELSLRSDAVRSGNEVWIWTELSTARSASLSISIPALMALSPLSRPVNGLNEYSDFLLRFDGNTKPFAPGL